MKKELIELDAEMQEDEEASSEDSFEVQCQVLALLLNHKVTAFHFPPELMDLKNEVAATELCRKLVAQRPSGLDTIVSLTSPSPDDFWDFTFTPLVMSMVDVLPNIEVLRMDGCVFGDTELCRIADQLPKLR